jgi:hypothetical protein
MKRLVFLSSLLLALVSCQENKPTETAMEEKGKCPFGFDKGQSAGSTLQDSIQTYLILWVMITIMPINSIVLIMKP